MSIDPTQGTSAANAAAQAVQRSVDARELARQRRVSQAAGDAAAEPGSHQPAVEHGIHRAAGDVQLARAAHVHQQGASPRWRQFLGDVDTHGIADTSPPKKGRHQCQSDRSRRDSRGSTPTRRRSASSATTSRTSIRSASRPARCRSGTSCTRTSAARSENPTQIGLGVGIAPITPVFTQGTIESSRVGDQRRDSGQRLLHAERLRRAVLHARRRTSASTRRARWSRRTARRSRATRRSIPVTKQVITTGTPTDIVVPPGILRAPVATSQFSAISNLNSQAVVGNTFTTSVQVFDSLGASHVTTMTYTKTGAGRVELRHDRRRRRRDRRHRRHAVPARDRHALVRRQRRADRRRRRGARQRRDHDADLDQRRDGAATSTGRCSTRNNSPLLTGFASPSATSSITQNGIGGGHGHQHHDQS